MRPKMPFLASTLGALITVGSLPLMGVVLPAQASSPIPQSVTAKATCSKNNAKPFVPTQAVFGPVGAAPIAGYARVNGVPGTAPLTDAGKAIAAWDRPGVKPGAKKGHVLMNAHAWPDGSALGNRLTAGLKKGAVIKVSGAKGKVQCYRVVKRLVKVETPKLAHLYYGTKTSKPMLAMVTCAGVRRGPGDWSHRAVWLAKPIA